jgi:hypothetical protein
VRDVYLRDRALVAYDALAEAEREALELALFRLMDEDIPLVGSDDRAVPYGPNVMGRPIPGTDLLVCYIPAGTALYVIDVVRC